MTGGAEKRSVGCTPELFGLSLAGVSVLLLMLIIFPLSGWAAVASSGCGAGLRRTLPDQPVSIERVERLSQGRILVSWSLAPSPKDFDSDTLPQRLQTGAEFDVLRCLPPGRWTVVGRGEVVGRNGALVEGQLTHSGKVPVISRGVSEDMVTAGNLYPLPMAGDFVVVRRTEVVQVKQISPRVMIPAASLFSSDGADGFQIDLSRSGQESLRDILTSRFAQARGKLLIEVYAQRTGSRQKLRGETLQRAESIGRFLRYEFGLEKSQIVEIGLGSDTFTAGFVSAQMPSDFVVLRMLPNQGELETTEHAETY
jgi:hypothetical protein